jgi:hypothetical protein
MDSITRSILDQYVDIAKATLNRFLYSHMPKSSCLHFVPHTFTVIVPLSY